jgi:hypothetical protein
MSYFTNYLYILILIQIIYAVSITIKAVMHKRDDSIIMFAAASTMSLLKHSLELRAYKRLAEVPNYGALLGLEQELTTLILESK